MTSPKTVEDVAAALELLGAAYRSDWNDFDGRTLKFQLEELAKVLHTGEWWGDGRRFNIRAWAEMTNICPDCHTWQKHCRCTKG